MPGHTLMGVVPTTFSAFIRVVMATSYTRWCVSRSSTVSTPAFPLVAIRFRSCPPTVSRNSGETWVRSQSWVSPGRSWSYHRSLPVRTSRATRGIGIEILPRPEMTSEVGGGVRDRDVQLLLRRIERERSPDRPTSLGEAHGIPPRLRTRLAWTGDGAEPPHRLAVCESESPDPSLNVVLAAGGSDHHEVVVHERWHRDGLAHVRASDVPCPEQLAVPGVEPQEIAVGRATHDIPPRERHPAVHRPQFVVSRLPRVSPPRTAGGGVDRYRLAHRGQVHHAAVHNWACLEGP